MDRIGEWISDIPESIASTASDLWDTAGDFLDRDVEIDDVIDAGNAIRNLIKEPDFESAVLDVIMQLDLDTCVFTEDGKGCKVDVSMQKANTALIVGYIALFLVLVMAIVFYFTRRK